MAASHQQLLSTVGPLAESRPDDLLADQLLHPVALVHTDRERAEPRVAQLHDAACALHAYATACTRAVLLLDARPASRTDG